MQTMIQLGVSEMPREYILRRWTWSAEENLVQEQPGQPAEMPEESRKKMWLSVNCNEFKGLALTGNETEDGRKIIRTHLKAMKMELNALKRETEKRAKKMASANAFRTNSAESAPAATTQSTRETQQMPRQTFSGPHQQQDKQTETSAPTQVTLHSATTLPQPQQNTQIQSSGPLHSAATSTATGNMIPGSIGAGSVPETSETSQTPIIRDPPVSNTKGRKRKKAYENPLNIGRKEIRLCKQCGSSQHDTRTCSERGQMPEQN
jgi:hypothetical protein